MPTEAEVQAMLARAEAATPEPWVARSRDMSGSGWENFEIEGPPAAPLRGQFRRGPDAAFIAAARADVPALAHEVLALRKALQDLYDVQNGAPLPKYEADWTQAMAQAEALLRAEKLLEQDEKGGNAAW